MIDEQRKQIEEEGLMCASLLGSFWYDDKMNRLENIIITHWRKI